eukprot:TRINITY_DN29723_c0_g1_i3.p1 TRINITY_DN29723_c0_g1~~TRINITY_DN29723_c0_g1_i3.p1  ORF type:complete len:820 (-),score=191.03 TRINITY_DN29723_c0_g1_i3:388-2763(-)
MAAFRSSLAASAVSPRPGSCYSCFGAAAALSTLAAKSSSAKKLRLRFGAAGASKKTGTVGEDAYFAAHSSNAFGVADGVGGWASQGVDSGLYSRTLLRNVQDELDALTLKMRKPDLPSVLLKSWQSLQREATEGSCTVVLGHLAQDLLHVLHLGDSGLLVLRPTKLLPQFHGGQEELVLRQVYGTSAILHKENMPCQMAAGDSDDLEHLDLVSVKLLRGDILIAGSDGLFDNMSLQDLQALVLSHLERGDSKKGQGSSLPSSLAASIVQRAAEAARQEVNQSGFGGKLDDIAVIVAQAEKWTPAALGGLLHNLAEATSSGGSVDATGEQAQAASYSQASGTTTGGARSFSTLRQLEKQPEGQGGHGGAALAASRSSSSSSGAVAASGSEKTIEGSLLSLRIPPTGVKAPSPQSQAAAAAETWRLRVGKHLGSGSHACCWALLDADCADASTDSGPIVAVVKQFYKPEPVFAALYGHEFVQELEEVPRRERRVGEVLRLTTAHEGRRFVAQLLATQSEAQFEEEDLCSRAPSGPFLVFQYAGQPLEKAVARLGLGERFALVDRLLVAVDYLRLCNVVHGDVSLGNCCLGEDNLPRLVDFGNAVLFESSRSRQAPSQRLEKLRSKYVHHKRFPAAERYSYPVQLGRLIEAIEIPRQIKLYEQSHDPDIFPGNLAATPPEVLRGAVVPGQSDTYGVAVMLWQMLTTEETPFDIDVECERIRFEGWNSYYKLTESEKLTYLQDRLDRTLQPELKDDWVALPGKAGVFEWLREALAELPEERQSALERGLEARMKS